MLCEQCQKIEVAKNTVSKKFTRMACSNFDIRETILIIFERNVTEKVNNQKMYYFTRQLTSASAAKQESRKLHLFA